MSDNTTVVLNNYSDDARIKQYVSEVLAPRVFHDIPLNVLNTGFFSLVNEYMSQSMEQQAYTSAFYFNESFITKAVLPDSIYANAALFNIGYAFATPSTCNFLLELKIEDIYNNAVRNPATGLYEFILDKNTKFNLSNGSVYSLDYDILIQYQKVETSSSSSPVPSWNVQYINRDIPNCVAVNKNVYITYRVTDVWLCLCVTASEYERQSYVVTNNMTNGIPNADKVITCDNHICGFDVKYTDGSGKETYLSRDHILPIHANVTDSEPYIHYIMDNPQTIRFMFQLNGSRYFIPDTNSKFEIIVYTCHGEAANFTGFKNDEQPSVITAANKYTNNANVMKAAFVISGSMGGTNIGTTETVRRETIEAYNTANAITTDHDIDEWFKTFFFKNVLYPFFFKRRDDPWERLWSGYIALKDDDDYVFRTNTLHGLIPYDVLYSNNDNTVGNNEIIIPPGWLWKYTTMNQDDPHGRFTVTPYIAEGSKVETARTSVNVNEQFMFANPFGIRIQKEPFAIGYFNPWISDYVTATKLNLPAVVNDDTNDISYIYHATPITTKITRTYKDDYYTIKTYIVPTVTLWKDGEPLVKYVRKNAIAPIFTNNMWTYFNKPLDLYASNIPVLPLRKEEVGYIAFNPYKTYFCVRTKNRIDENRWSLDDIWIDDDSEAESKRIFIPITGDITMLYGDDKLWGTDGRCKDYSVYVTGDTEITTTPNITEESPLQFEQVSTQNYYELKLKSSANFGAIESITVGTAYQTKLSKFGESNLAQIGLPYTPSVYLTIRFADNTETQLTISNAAYVYMPYEFESDGNGGYIFHLSDVGPDSVLLYAEMKPTPGSGAVDYYRIPFSELKENEAMFYIANKLLPMDLNNMRVVLHSMVNGSESGRVEMQPVQNESDGSYSFEVNMIPLNELVDVDNRINIASVNNGGGSWVSANPGSGVTIDAVSPELQISILVRSDDTERPSEISSGDTFTGFRLVDRYVLDDVTLVQELKDMRSVVNFGDSSAPTQEQINLYNSMIALDSYDERNIYTIYTLREYAYKRMNEIEVKLPTFIQIREYSNYVNETLKNDLIAANKLNISGLDSSIQPIISCIDEIISYDKDNRGDELDWSHIWEILNDYTTCVNAGFDSVNINGGVTVQLIPFVEYSSMMSPRFESFVSAFTTVNEAIEPVIFKRLEGNNHLDVKLIATYGKPHSYVADVDYKKSYNENTVKFWPDLHVQLEFDVRLYNQALSTNTVNELRSIVKSYFNRLTSIHTPVDQINMDNNIYISHVIQQLEAHANVAWLKFKGWYTEDKNKPNGNYKDANTQGIVRCWNKLEDMPKLELERYTPEMFIMNDDDIVINIV